MTVPAAGPVVSFRDADQPRAMAAGLIAVAHRHPLGWSVNTADGSHIEAVTFESMTDAVTAVTGVRHLLIVWTGRDAG